MPSPENWDSQVAWRTQAVRAGELPASGEHPLIEPIVQSSVYAFNDARQADDCFAAGRPLYARDGLPNVRSLERTVAQLEGAEDAIAVSSGMAAIATTFLALLRAGDHVLLGLDGYCESTALLQEMVDHFGIQVTAVDLNDATAVETAITPATRLVFAETISNPGMHLVDLAALAEVTRRRGVLLVVDNTFATPVLCQPIALGADLVVHSAGKFLGGHSDVTAGIVAGPTALVAELKRSARLYGPVLAPMEAWLTLRGIKTLLPRISWASQSAAQIASWLAGHPAVEAVHYSGLSHHDQVDLARRMMPRGAGSVLSFWPRGGVDAAVAIVDRLKVIPYVPSIGGVVTIVSFPARTHCSTDTGSPVPIPHRSSTIRLSIGLEDPTDIIADFDQAFTSLSEAHAYAPRSAS